MSVLWKLEVRKVGVNVCLSPFTAPFYPRSIILKRKNIVYRKSKFVSKLTSLLLIAALGGICSSAYAWRFLPGAEVTDIVPFPGGFDVKPVNITITGCPDWVRVQSGIHGLSDIDVNRYLSIVLAAHATNKQLAFIIDDNACTVYRVIFK